MIDLRPKRLVRQDIVDAIVAVTHSPIVGPTVPLRIRERDLFQPIRTLPRSKDLLNRRLVPGVVEIAVDQQVFVWILGQQGVNMLPEQASLITPKKRFSRWSR